MKTFPNITKERQSLYEKSIIQNEYIPQICGIHGRACRRMNSQADRVLCSDCSLALFCKVEEAVSEKIAEKEKIGINKNLIKRGIEKGIVSIIDDGTSGTLGIACKIGDFAFYLSGFDSQNYNTVDEYLDAHNVDEIVENIYETIKDARTADENGIDENEYAYYLELLQNNIR